MDRETAEPAVDSMPGDRAKRWVEYHHEHAATTTYVYDFVWDITEEAEGPFCTDVDGNVLMDFTCHVASAPLGYNNPRILDRLAAFDLVDPTKIAGQDFYVAGGWPPDDPALDGPSQLMDRLTDLTSDYGLDTVFLSNSGAEAIENAIKLCYADRGHRAFTFEGGFHGRTLGALSLNRSKVNHRKGYPEVPGVMSVPFCACDGDCDCGWRTDGPGGNVIADRLDADRGNVDPDEVSFVVLEPQQGEGGYRVPNPEFVRDVADLQAEHGVRVVADEIQSGLGRTGEMWGVDHYDLEPDVITSAKGLRVGATVADETLFPEERARLSSTWGAGDVLAAAQGVATIDAIVEDGLLANVRERSEQFYDRLADERTPNVVDVRGRGLMLGIEFDTKDRREAVVANALQRGLLTLGCGYKTLRVLPPLDVTEREVDIGVDLLLDAIREADTAQTAAVGDSSDAS